MEKLSSLLVNYGFIIFEKTNETIFYYSLASISIMKIIIKVNNISNETVIGFI